MRRTSYSCGTSKKVEHVTMRNKFKDAHDVNSREESFDI